jgi:phthalate 4,5-dioxygenase
MVTRAEDELMTRVEGDAPLGRLMRAHYWVPFALSDNLVAGDAPTPVRLFGEDYVAFRAPDRRIGFLDEHCPHRRASLALARTEGDALRCIYHGWKIDVSGRVVEAPTQLQRHEQFCAAVPVLRFPVHEEGGIAWVWLGGGEAPPFPDLPFNDTYRFEMVMTISLVAANWLQGLEGGIDSVHGTILHRSVIEEILREKGQSPNTAGVQATGATHLFCFTPVDDTHHLLFFGNYGETPLPFREVSGARHGVVPDPHNFASLGGDRSNRWGQDRELMANGHWSGFGRSAIDEDAVVQVSMGPIVDRTMENLSSSDVAITQTRRLILDTIAAAGEGRLPPGSARTPGGVRVPQPFDALLEAGEAWRERARV